MVHGELKKGIKLFVFLIIDRFSEIYDFNEMLNSLFSHLPKLPSKTLFKVIEHEDVEERREELKIYFSEIAKRNEIVNSEAFVEFFFVLKFAPSLLV